MQFVYSIERYAGSNPLYDDSSFVCIRNKVCQNITQGPHDPDLIPKSVVRCLCEPDGSSLDSVPCWPREDHFLMGLGGSHGNESRLPCAVSAPGYLATGECSARVITAEVK